MDWLQHVIDWAQAHPGLSLAAAFILAVLECTVLLGLFLPGSGVLFALGALVSLDALPFGATMGLVAGGALIGDITSYEIGRRYGAALFRRPFLAKRAKLIEKGGAFFRRHGGKGVIMAHLVGPLRPLIPAIAGVYGMPRLRFWLAIVPAAIAWTALYTLPGVAFGASLGLAAEVTKRLAIVILVLAVGLWIALWLTREAVVVLGRNAERWLNQITDWSHRHGPLGRLGAGFADPREPEVPALVSLGLVLFVLSAIAIAVTWGLGGKPPAFDLYAHDALQNLHDPWSIRLATLALLPGDPVAYGSFGAVLLTTMLLNGRWDVIRHFVVLLTFAIAATVALSALPNLLPPPPEASSLRLYQDLALPICIYLLIPVLFSGGQSTNRRVASYGLAATVLLLLILARFYLGGVWLSVGAVTVIFALVWTAGVGVSFRRHGSRDLTFRGLSPALVVLLIVLAFGTHVVRTRVKTAMPELAARSMAMSEWWETGWKRLPSRRIDVAGRDKQFLNLQWAAQLPIIRDSLQKSGWESPSRLTFANGLRWLASSTPIDQLPLMPRTHAGRHASLTLRHDLDADHQLMIRLWPSGYVLDGQTPLWIGTVTTQRGGEMFHLLRYPISEDSYSAALAQLSTPEFATRDVRRSPVSTPVRLLRETQGEWR